MSLNSKKQLSPLLLFAFLIPLLYWIYLAFISQMVVVHDAAGYEQFGLDIAQNGWINYFKSGPNREPFYPWAVSLTMQLANLLQIDYQHIIRIIQIFFLFSTQILSLIILKKLKINPWITALSIFYIGLSPSLVNAAFVLFSEAVTYPFILGIIILSVQFWIKKPSLKKNDGILFGTILGLLFICITFIKAVFGYVFCLFLIPFLWQLIIKEKMRHAPLLFFFISSVITFNLFMIPYKLMNKKYNGQYTFTDRGPWLLYGTTARRLQPLTKEKTLACLAQPLGNDVCLNWFSKESCAYWQFEVVEKLGADKRQQLERNFSTEQIDQQLTRAAFQEVVRNPIQYFSITFIDGLKMLFWETANIGFVVFPSWIEKFFSQRWIEKTFNFTSGILTITALIFTTLFLLREKKFDDIFYTTIFFTFLLIISFLFMQGLILTFPRYILPIAPLYIIVITNFIQSRFKNKT